MAMPVNAVFWGNSHAYHLIDFMDQLGKEHGLRLHDLTMTMCPPNADGQPTPHGYLPGDAYLAATLARLSAANKRVIFVDDIPIVPPALDNCLSNRLYLPTASDNDCTYDES